MIQGRILDSTSAAVSFLVPAFCFAVVAAYAVLRPAHPQHPAHDRGSRVRFRKTLTVLASAVLLAGCSGGDRNYADPTDKVEVLSWWSSESERPAFAVLADAFEAKNPASNSSTPPSWAAAVGTPKSPWPSVWTRNNRRICGRVSLARPWTVGRPHGASSRSSRCSRPPESAPNCPTRSARR